MAKFNISINLIFTFLFLVVPLAYPKEKITTITNFVDIVTETEITNYYHVDVTITNIIDVFITNQTDITNIVFITNTWTTTNIITQHTISRNIIGIGLGYRVLAGISYEAIYGYQVWDFLPMYLGASVVVDTSATLSVIALWKF